MLRTFAITWPQGVLGNELSLAVAAQVHGDVRQLIQDDLKVVQGHLSQAHRAT